MWRAAGLSRATRALRLGLAAGLLLAGAGLVRPAPSQAAGWRQGEEDDEWLLYVPLLYLAETPSRLVFHSDYEGNDEIYRMQANGTGLQRLTNTTFTWLDQSPAWGPGQSKIVFQSNRDGDNEIFVMNADGSNVQQLTNNTCADITPHWSHVNNRIAWASNCNNPGGGVDYEIWTMDADGENEAQITFNTQPDSVPRWSTTTTQLAYVSNNTNIATMNANGTGSTVITAGTDPDWSPSGQQILYACNDGSGDGSSSDREVCLINATGGGFVQLTHLDSFSYGPVWAPGGLALAFISNYNTTSFAYDIYTTTVAVDATIYRVPSLGDIPAGTDEGSVDW